MSLTAEVDVLERLVTILHGAVGAGGDPFAGPHRLVIVTGTGDGDLELALTEFDEHPLEVLLGFRAEADWLAVGLVMFGWAAPVAEGRPSEHAERRRVRTTMMCDRSGRVASTATLSDGEVIDEEPVGPVAEALRKVFGERGYAQWD